MILVKIIDDFFFPFVNTLLLDRQLKYTMNYIVNELKA